MANFFMRITDVISANINEMVDRVEDPERMIKQIIREMEENIRRAREGVLDALTSEKQLAKELKHHRQESLDWGARAEKAMRSGKDELTRKALTRKKEHDRIIKDLARTWESARKTSENLKSQLRKLENKLKETRRKRSTLAARQRVAVARQHMSSTVHCFEKGLNTQDRFIRMEERVEEMEARTDAIMELDDDQTELEKEFDELEIETDVDAEFEELKKKIELA